MFVCCLLLVVGSKLRFVWCWLCSFAVVFNECCCLDAFASLVVKCQMRFNLCVSVGGCCCLY